MTLENMPIDYLHALITLLPEQQHNIAHYILPNGEKVWVRKAGKQIPQWRYTLIGFLAHVFRLDALTPVPHPGGKAVITTEAARLQTLAAHDVRVPRMLAQTENGLMITHLGERTWIEQMERTQAALEVWQQGLEALHKVHEQGQYLSEAFARNMIACEDGSIGFIDFEEDPGLYMNREQCQSRDYLCYLQSTAILLQKYHRLNAAAQCWQQHTSLLLPLVTQQINAAVRPLLWMRAIHHPRWGRDTLRLAALAALFSQNRH